MSQHASHCLFTERLTRLELVPDTEPAEQPTNTFPRWSKILDARNAIKDGLYDDNEIVAARLDACMDRLLEDVCTAE